MRETTPKYMEREKEIRTQRVGVCALVVRVTSEYKMIRYRGLGAAEAEVGDDGNCGRARGTRTHEPAQRHTTPAAIQREKFS
jgi:hypothetical protein